MQNQNDTCKSKHWQLKDAWVVARKLIKREDVNAVRLISFEEDLTISNIVELKPAATGLSTHMDQGLIGL